MNPNSSKVSFTECVSLHSNTKKCIKCGVVKSLDQFHKKRNQKDGLDPWCKSCKSEYKKERYQANKEAEKLRVKKYKAANREKVLEGKREHYRKNRDIINSKKREKYAQNEDNIQEIVRITNKKYREEHQEEIVEYGKKYYEDNKEEIDAKNRDNYYENRAHYIKVNNEYTKKRCEEDINYKLARTLRRRLWMALKNNFKSGSAVRDLGCSIAFLREHLASMFKPGMTWDNWGVGKGKWHIDHIRPFSSFNLEDREQVLEACNYKNLQPLWFEENMAKSGKLNWPKKVCEG